MKENFAVSNIKLSRDLTVPNFPTRIQAVVRSFGTRQQSRRIHLEVNGQRITERTIKRTIPANGEATVEFDNIKLPTTGSWVISVALDSDQLPGDNRADAAITVAEAIPVLIIDGDWDPDPTQRESFFARAALSSSENENPWVLAKPVASSAFESTDLRNAEVVIVANVPQLDEQQVAALKDFVNRGGGVLFCAGGRVDSANWNELLYGDGASLLPAKLGTMERDPTPQEQAIRLSEKSLELPWVQQFLKTNGGDLVDTAFTQWWRAKIAPRQKVDGALDPDKPIVSDPTVVMRLTTGDPLLVTRQYGKGRVLMMTTPIDADWSRLPAQQDFVPFLHEAVFHLASAQVARNVAVGSPLVQPAASAGETKDFLFVGPDNIERDAEAGGDELRPAIRLSDTRLPGVYQLKQRNAKDNTNSNFFVVNGDRRESDLTPLDDPAIDQLQAKDRMKFIATVDELTRKMYDKETPTNIWKPLLLVFILFLIGELLLTRRLVKGGHAPPPQQQLEEPEILNEPKALHPEDIDDFVDDHEEADMFDEIETL